MSSSLRVAPVRCVSLGAPARAAPVTAAVPMRAASRPVSLGKRNVAAAAAATGLSALDVAVLGDRILIRKEEADQTNNAGLINMGEANDDFVIGEVVSVGDTVEMEGVVKGAKLLIAGYGGMAVKLDDEQLFFIKDQDIMGVVSE